MGGDKRWDMETAIYIGIHLIFRDCGRRIRMKRVRMSWRSLFVWPTGSIRASSRLD